MTLQRRGAGRAGLLRIQAAAAVLLALLGHLLPASTGAAAPRALLAAAPISLLSLLFFYLKESLPESRSSIDIGTCSPQTVLLHLIARQSLMTSEARQSLMNSVMRFGLGVLPVSLYTGSLCVVLCSALASALAVVLARRGEGGGRRAPPVLARFLGAHDVSIFV